MDKVSSSQYYRQNLSGLTPQQRHQQLVSHALQQQPGPQQGIAGLQATETDFDALAKHHRFLRGPEDDAVQGANSWGARLARRYYARLFKEYAIADLSRYKESKIGLRWRTQAEVVAGKGQFTCGAKGCDGTAGLCAYEVNFAYQEAGQQKQALVKLCLCQDCACKLDYRREKDKQYRRLGSLTALDRQIEQQRREDNEHQQQREAAGDRRRKDRDRIGRLGHNDNGQRQQQWDVRESGEAAGVVEQSYRQRDRSQDDMQRRSGCDGPGHGCSRGSSRRAGGPEARPNHDGGESRDRGRSRGSSDRGQLEEGEVNDMDIEQWLDSLFTAVPASGTA